MMSHARLFSFVVAVLLIATLFAGLAAVPAAAQFDTMQFRYDIARTGDFNPVAGSGPSNGNLLWNYKTGGSVTSSPAVVDGVVYVGSESPDNNVYALNATTGLKLWNSPVGGGVTDSSPAVVDGMVYVGAEDNQVYAYNATFGTIVWHHPTGIAVHNSSPAVVNG